MKNKLLKLVWYCYHLGIANGLKIIFTLFMGKKGKVISLKLPHIKHPIFIRAKSSDEYTFQQIFINKEYAFEYSGTPRLLVDAGANIGLAAIYFANRFPGCKFICLEPESNNFALLQKNIENYPEIKAVQAGLWGKSAHLKIRDEGLGNWGFIVEETSAQDPDAIKAYSLPDVVKHFGFDLPDIVKMDIEGSEKEVLEASDLHEWLSGCEILIIELHDRMKKGTSASLFRALLQYDVQVEQLGENLICRISKTKRHHDFSQTVTNPPVSA